METQKENTQKSFLERYFDFMDKIEGKNQKPWEQIYRHQVLGEPTNKQKAEKLKDDVKQGLTDVVTFKDLRNLWHILFTPDSVLNKELKDNTINYLDIYK